MRHFLIILLLIWIYWPGAFVNIDITDFKVCDSPVEILWIVDHLTTICIKKKLPMLIHSKLHLKSCAFWYLYTNASLPSGCENIIQYKLECSSCENVTHHYTVVLIKLLNQGSFLPITVLYKTLISQGQSSFIVKWLS